MRSTNSFQSPCHLFHRWPDFLSVFAISSNFTSYHDIMPPLSSSEPHSLVISPDIMPPHHPPHDNFPFSELLSHAAIFSSVAKNGEGAVDDIEEYCGAQVGNGAVQCTWKKCTDVPSKGGNMYIQRIPQYSCVHLKVELKFC